MPKDLLGGIDLLGDAPVDLLVSAPEQKPEEPKDLLGDQPVDLLSDNKSFPVANPFLQLGAGDKKPFAPYSGAAGDLIAGTAKIGSDIASIPAMLSQVTGVTPPDWMLNNPINNALDHVAASASYNMDNYPGENAFSLAGSGRLMEAADYTLHTFAENLPQQAALYAMYTMIPATAVVKAGKLALDARTAATLTSFASTAGSGKYRQSMNEGIDPLRSMVSGAINGSLEALGEMIGSIPVMKYAENFLTGFNKPITKMVGGKIIREVPYSAKQMLGNTVRYLLASGGMEGTEEFFTQLGQDIADSALKTSDFPDGVVPASEYLPRAFEAGLHGALQGVGLGTMATVDFVRQNDAKRRAILDGEIEKLKGTGYYTPYAEAYADINYLRSKTLDVSIDTAMDRLNRSLGIKTYQSKWNVGTNLRKEEVAKYAETVLDKKELFELEQTASSLQSLKSTADDRVKTDLQREKLTDENKLAVQENVIALNKKIAESPQVESNAVDFAMAPPPLQKLFKQMLQSNEPLDLFANKNMFNLFYNRGADDTSEFYATGRTYDENAKTYRYFVKRFGGNPGVPSMYEYLRQLPNWDLKSLAQKLDVSNGKTIVTDEKNKIRDLEDALRKQVNEELDTRGEKVSWDPPEHLVDTVASFTPDPIPEPGQPTVNDAIDAFAQGQKEIEWLKGELPFGKTLSGKKPLLEFFAKKVEGRTFGLDQPGEQKTYEVSSVGDKRFSALYARLKSTYPGRTIEDVYQNTLKGSGKGRPPAKGSPLYGKTIKESFEAYKNLWRIWLKENPNAAKFISEKVASGYKLTDKFAKTEVNQARALTELADELIVKVEKDVGLIAERLAANKNPREMKINTSKGFDSVYKRVKPYVNSLLAQYASLFKVVDMRGIRIPVNYPPNYTRWWPEQMETATFLPKEKKRGDRFEQEEDTAEQIELNLPNRARQIVSYMRVADAPVRTVNIGAGFVVSKSGKASESYIRMDKPFLEQQFKRIKHGEVNFTGVVPFSKTAFDDFGNAGLDAYMKYALYHEQIHGVTGIDGTWLDENLVKLLALEKLAEETPGEAPNLAREIATLREEIRIMAENPTNDLDNYNILIARNANPELLYQVSYRANKDKVIREPYEYVEESGKNKGKVYTGFHEYEIPAGTIHDTVMKGSEVRNLVGSIVSISPYNENRPFNETTSQVEHAVTASLVPRDIQEKPPEGLNILNDFLGKLGPEEYAAVKAYMEGKGLGPNFSWDDMIEAVAYVPEARAAAAATMAGHGAHDAIEELGKTAEFLPVTKEQFEDYYEAQVLDREEFDLEKIVTKGMDVKNPLAKQANEKIREFFKTIPGKAKKQAYLDLALEESRFEKISKENVFIQKVIALFELINNGPALESFAQKYPKGIHMLNSFRKFLQNKGATTKDGLEDLVLKEFDKRVEEFGQDVRYVDMDNKVRLDLDKLSARELGLLLYYSLPNTPQWPLRDMVKSIVNKIPSYKDTLYGLDTPTETPKTVGKPVGPSTFTAANTRVMNFIHSEFDKPGSWKFIHDVVSPKTKRVLSALQEYGDRFLQTSGMRKQASEITHFLRTRIKAAGLRAESKAILNVDFTIAAFEQIFDKYVKQNNLSEEQAKELDYRFTASLEEFYVGIEDVYDGNWHYIRPTNIGFGVEGNDDAFWERNPNAALTAKVDPTNGKKFRPYMHYFGSLPIELKLAAAKLKADEALLKEMMIKNGFWTDTSVQAMTKHGYLSYRYKVVDKDENGNLSTMIYGGAGSARSTHLKSEFFKESTSFDDFIVRAGAEGSGLVPLQSWKTIMMDYYVENYAKLAKKKAADELRATANNLVPNILASDQAKPGKPITVVMTQMDMAKYLEDAGWKRKIDSVTGKKTDLFVVPDHLTSVFGSKTKNASGVLQALGYKNLGGSQEFAVLRGHESHEGSPWVPVNVWKEFVDVFTHPADNLLTGSLAKLNFLAKLVAFSASPLFQLFQVSTSAMGLQMAMGKKPTALVDAINTIWKNNPKALNPFHKTGALGTEKYGALETLFVPQEEMIRAAEAGLSWVNPKQIFNQYFDFITGLPDGSFKTMAEALMRTLSWNSRWTFETMLGNMSVQVWKQASDYVKNSRGATREEADHIAAKMVNTITGAPGRELYGSEEQTLNAIVFAKEFSVQMARTLTATAGLISPGLSRGEAITSKARWAKSLFWGDVNEAQMRTISSIMGRMFFLNIGAYMLLTNIANMFTTALFGDDDDREKKWWERSTFQNEEGKRLMIYIGTQDGKRKYIQPPILQELTSTASFLPSEWGRIGKGPFESVMARASAPLRMASAILNNVAFGKNNTLMIDTQDKVLSDYFDATYKVADMVLPEFLRSSRDETKTAMDWFLTYGLGSPVSKGIAGYNMFKSMNIDPYDYRRANERITADKAKSAKKISNAPTFEDAMARAMIVLRDNPSHYSVVNSALQNKMSPEMKTWRNLQLNQVAQSENKNAQEIIRRMMQKR